MNKTIKTILTVGALTLSAAAMAGSTCKTDWLGNYNCSYDELYHNNKYRLVRQRYHHR